MTSTRRADAVVVGAGTAGANAAHQLAARGLDVVLVERRHAEDAGAQWHNGVLDWQFEAAGLAPPTPPERGSSGGTTHLIGPDGTHGVTVHDSPIARADMGLLGRRLRALAVDGGVELVDHVTDLDVELHGERVVALDAVVGEGDAASALRLEAPLFVDASGRTGALRRRSPVLAPWCPDVGGEDLCTASDHEMLVADRDGAQRFLDRHRAQPGEGVTVVGLEGGWSTRAITVAPDLSHASVLVGCIGDGRFSTGPRMLEATRAAEPWLGDDVSSGSGVIPLRRPYSRFTAPGLALVGDAACQVFPAHGSGIGLGLIAGRMLADAVAGADDPGDPAVLWRYQAAFWREHGGTLAAFDAFRRMSTALGGDGVGAMVRAGLLTEAMTRGGLDQRWVTPSPSALPAMLARMVRVPAIAARMVPFLARGQLLRTIGGRHPATLDEDALVRWDRRLVRVEGR